jgi:four helix bundle protein
MEHKAEELNQRTKTFALRIIRLVRSLPGSSEGRVIGTQLLRSGTSVTSNYPAAYRSRSRGGFLSKLSIVFEEADEGAFWLELLTDAGIVARARLHNLGLKRSSWLRSSMPHEREPDEIHNQQSKMRNQRCQAGKQND